MRLFKRGDVYYYQFEYEKKRYVFSTHLTKKKEAEKVAEAERSRIIREQTGVIPKKINIPFQKIWAEYTKTANDMTNKQYYGKHLLRYFKDKNIVEITREDVIEFQNARKTHYIKEKYPDREIQDISFRGINITTNILSNLLNYCVTRGYINTNPAVKLKKLREGKRDRVLSDNEIMKLQGACQTETTRNIVAFLILTGVRVSEALAIRWTDIDDDKIRIYRSKTQSASEIPVTTGVRTILERQTEHKGKYLFEYRGRKIGSIKKSFTTAVRRAGLEDVHIHDLRRTYITRLIRAGIDIKSVMDSAGHTNIETTARYMGATSIERKAEINAVVDKLLKEYTIEELRDSGAEIFSYPKNYDKNFNKDKDFNDDTDADDSGL